jgi:hypothetical protein
MASGHVNRTKRPNTWLLRPDCDVTKVPCQRGAVHTWHKMLRSRSRAASRLTWGTFNQIKQRTPLLRPKLRLPYRELQAFAVL